MNLAWKLHRLSAMSSREIGYRVQQQVRASIDQFRIRGARVPLPRATADAVRWLDELPNEFDRGKYRRAADAILAGEFRVFAMQPAQLGFPPHWNRDPKTGTVAPLTFGKTLNYRDEALVGDIKYLWEPSRHAELVTLAQAWHLTREPRYSQGCRTLLESWFEQCPWGYGPHWTSSLEHAIRLMNWSFAWHLLGGEQATIFRGEGAAFRERWLMSIYQHCDFIAGHFSRFSSANNHLLGELAGLFIASVTWPLWERSTRWRRSAQREFEQEALRQTAPDGVNREQANWYHQEVADMMVVVGLVARAAGHDFSAAYWARLNSMFDYLASVMDVAGHVPNFGDADDAIIARLDPAADFDPYRSALSVGAAWFGRGELKRKSAGFDDKTRWLLGDRAAQRFATLPVPTESALPRRRFEHAGYYILGSDFDTDTEVRLVADAGPLGYLSIAAHGHADALSFTLSAAGHELLIDPGTFAYHTHKRWRDYFRGTSAHNTVRIDGVDQSVSGGNFLWRTHAQARMLDFVATQGVQRWSGEHDGYLRLPDPVRHRRELIYDAHAHTLEVHDDLRCDAAHRMEMFWHFDPACDVRVAGHEVMARCGPVLLVMYLPYDLNIELVRGDENSPLGWVSRSFDQREPTQSLRCSRAIAGHTRCVTRMTLEFMHSAGTARS